MDLTGTTLFLYLKFGSGFVQDPSMPGGFVFYAKSGSDWVWGQAPGRTSIPAGQARGGGTRSSWPTPNRERVEKISIQGRSRRLVSRSTPAARFRSRPEPPPRSSLDGLGYVDDGAPLP